MDRKVWLKCKVYKGMLPGEWAIQSETADKRIVSLFAAQQDVKVTGIEKDGARDGYLQVEVLDETDKYSLVSLPSPALETSSTIKVCNTELQEAIG